MNEKENKKRLKQTMALLQIKIENIKPHIEAGEGLDGLYNKMLIEKAILKKELDNIGKKKPNIIQKIKKFVRPKEKTLISDYFRS